MSGRIIAIGNSRRTKERPHLGVVPVIDPRDQTEEVARIDIDLSARLVGRAIANPILGPAPG